MLEQRFIVAEIHKNWDQGVGDGTKRLISQEFEKVIEKNLERGYRLHSFDLNQVITDYAKMSETIIALFEKIDDGIEDVDL
jgi:hypothetical protein